VALIIVRTLNPGVVRVPDGRIGVMVGRIDLHACIEFGTGAALENFPLDELDWLHIAPFPWIDSGQHPT
jgi:hypothetical protein